MSLYTKISGVLNIIKFKKACIAIGSNFRVIGKCMLSNQGIACIGDNFRCFSGFGNPMGRNVISSFRIGPKAKLSIGNNVGISSTCIWCDCDIRIDDYVTIGAQTIVADTDAHSLDPQVRITSNMSNKGAKLAPIHIKRNAFIGAGCFITKGVTIGENSVIGAYSVVTRNIPDNEIWAGNPARFVKKVCY